MMFFKMHLQGEGGELLADIHGGDCGHHSSSQTLVGKVFRSGFFGPWHSMTRLSW